MNDLDSPINILKLGIATCRCGRQAVVKSGRIREHQFQHGEASRMVRDSGCDAQKIKAWLDTLPYTDWWVISYKCVECGNSMTDVRNKMSKEEAEALADPDNFSPPHNQ
jgi:hypothetical protein